MVILGLNAYGYNSAAALLVDGKLVAAAEEERFVREKYYNDLPFHAARFCLAHAGITADDIDAVAFYMRFPTAYPHYVAHVFRHFPAAMPLLTETGSGPDGYDDRRHPFKILRVGRDLLWGLGADIDRRTPTHFIRHHTCHAAPVFALPTDDAAVLAIDAVGEWSTTVGFHAREGRLSEVFRVDFPHSLGSVYNAVTTWLGYDTLSGPGKVMGLSSYGDPERHGSLFDSLVELTPDGLFRVNLDWFCYHLQRRRRVTDRFVGAFGPPREPGGAFTDRHRDVAAALQRLTSKVILHLARTLRRRTGARDLMISGGVAMNCVANGAVAREGPFERVFVPSAPGDSGAAAGAAYSLHRMLVNPRARFDPERPDMGPSYAETEIERAIAKSGLRFRRPARPAGEAARLLASGEPVGFFQGRLELGPRALGFRSILADPRPAWMRDRLNRDIKRREEFRPYAPVVPYADAGRFFENGFASPHMSFVSDVKPGFREQLAAVTHVDGTARLQTVTPEAPGQAPLLAVIRAFDRLTGVPVLLNTSFNVAGEPIVCSPGDALDVLVRTDLNHLAIGPFMVAGPRAGSGR
ncbi:MAG: carbamoyl transferase [Deltaproteobacteria bacterium]|nr:carbamoyl transferase [Deltaproteobacteria bacterium]